MIIESAFYLLPSVWLKHYQGVSGEADLASQFRELINRLIPGTGVEGRAEIQQAYALNKTSRSGPKLKADLRVRSTYVTDDYVIKPIVWVEAKYYHRKRTGRLTERQIMALKRDPLRLCVLIKEDVGGVRDKGRYLCVIFHSKPNSKSGNAYSPFEPEGTGDPQLDCVLSPGWHKSLMRFDMETRLPAPLELSTQALTYAFGPLPTDTQSVYRHWGYLIRIFAFTLSFDSSDRKLQGLSLEYTEREHTWWSDGQAAAQEELARMLIEAALVTN